MLFLYYAHEVVYLREPITMCAINSKKLKIVRNLSISPRLYSALTLFTGVTCCNFYINGVVNLFIVTCLPKTLQRNLQNQCGRLPTLKAKYNPNNHYRICTCLFKLQYENDKKMKQVSTENLFKHLMYKDMKERCMFTEMCPAIGTPILMYQDFSLRVCKPRGRKIRNAS